MKLAERKMVELLRSLKEEYHLAGIKTEMEAEGSLCDDLYRLKDITSAAGVPITLKIGGCEAISDMFQAKVLGVAKLVAPMIETPYAARKFIEAAQTVFSADELEDTRLVINVETISAYKCYDKILALPQFSALSGIAIGRKDLSMSMNLTRNDMDGEQVLNICRDLLQKTKVKHPGCACVIGGIRGEATLAALRTLGQLLDAYETRKVIIAREGLTAKNAARGLKKAFEFELLWSRTKSEYYRRLAKLDDAFIQRTNKMFEVLP
jgi:hypothetical protein